MSVLFVNSMTIGANPGVDAIAQGLAHRLAQDGLEMRVLTSDFRRSEWREGQAAAVDAGVAAGVEAIVLYVNDPHNPAASVAAARAAGVPVFTLERPRFPVDGSVVYPNYQHGVFMMEYLASLLPADARVGVIGGPDVVDDNELLAGIAHGIGDCGLTMVNDPFDPRYRNVSDVSEGGYEMTMNLLMDFHELDAMVPYNDETMLGALKALRETRRLGGLKSVSRNGTPQAVEAVVAGDHDGTWDLDCPGIGVAVGDLVARQVAGGEDLDGLCVASPIGRMVTAENASKWVPWNERVPFIDLHEGL